MAISRRAIFTLALSVLSMLPFAAEAQQTAKKAASSSTGSNQKPIRIAVMQFSHETVTFLPYETTTNDFIYEGSPARGEALLESSPNGYIGGFVKVAREHANVELVGIESPLGSKKEPARAGSPRKPSTTSSTT